MIKGLRKRPPASAGGAAALQSAADVEGAPSAVREGARSRLLRLVPLFSDAPEGRLIQAGADGELTLARIRVLVTAGILLFGLLRHQTHPSPVAPDAALGLAGLACAVAIAVRLGVERILYRPWVGFATSLLDVSLVTVALGLYLVTGAPLAAVNSGVLFPLYFLAIGATSVRLDHRVCALTGAVAFAGYLAIVLGAALATGSVPGWAGTVPAPGFHWSEQAGRLALLVCAGWISTLVVLGAQRLRQLSATDPLTGLMNRRAFEERLVEETARARRYGRPLSMAMIDIDYFKQFNDTYGHAAGDECLRNVAATLRNRLRTGDVVARYGGEEFVILLPETQAHTAVAIAEQLRRAVAATPIRIPGVRDPTPVTISIGVSTWPEHGQEISRLQERADDRLYQAKLAGRDQVVGPGPHPVL